MMTNTSETLRDEIKRLAAEAGFLACGIAPVSPFREFEAALDHRVAHFPEAAPLYEEMRNRVDLGTQHPWARSLVVGVRHYGKYALPPQPVGHIGRLYLCDWRIDACPDSQMQTRFVEGMRALGLRVQGVELPQRWAGARAGLTRFGHNNFAYANGGPDPAGSWIVIASWLVDAELPADEPTLDSPCPPGCRACIEACPTGALVEPMVMRMDRCIARLTYHTPHPVAPELWADMGSWVYGCDVCQEVCPLNRGAWQERELAPWLDEVAELLTPHALATMSEETYRRCIHPLFWYISADDVERWRRNAQRALDAMEG
jgi:epoxyqueuosine reductase